MCEYSSTDFSAGTSLTLGTWEGTKAAATGTPSRVPVPISGVGDEALNLNYPNDGSQLYVRRGDQGFILSVTSPDIAAQPDRGLALEKVLALKNPRQFLSHEQPKS